jgi:hypothetical protein
MRKPSRVPPLLLLLPGLAAAFEFYVGVTDLTPASNVIVWANASWADGLSVGFPPTYTPADLSRIAGSGLRLLPCIHANVETLQRQLEDHGADQASMAPYTLALTTVLSDMAAATSGSPLPFWWWALVEDDSSGVGFSYQQLGIRPSDAASAWAQWDLYLQRSVAVADAVLPAAAAAPRVAQVGFGEVSHTYAARGVDLLLVERANDDIGDLSTAVAFARGAARQYGCGWGVDFSWWWGVVYSGVNAMPALFHRRHAVLTYFAGANAANIEGGDGLVDGTGLHPTLLGQEMQRFGEFVKAHQARRREMEKTMRGERGGGGAPPPPPPQTPQTPQTPPPSDAGPRSWRRRPRRPSISQLGPTAGEAVTPVVVILPKDHAYQTRPYWATQASASAYARLPPRQGDAGIAGFFASAFPGASFAQDAFPFGAYASDDPPASPFAESAITQQYAPTPDTVFTAAPPVPFGTFPNRTAAASFFEGGNVDPSPWRPMADARWGGIIDVAVAGLGLSSMAPASGLQPNNVLQQGQGQRQRQRQKQRKRQQKTDTKAWAEFAATASTTEAATAAIDPDVPPLDGYSLALLLGPVNLTATLKAALLAFAEGGGTVVVAAGVAGPADADLVGATIVPELRVGRAWAWASDGARTGPTAEPFRFTPLSGMSPNCTVLASTTAGSPLVLRNGVGAGAVVTSLVPWFVGGDGSGLARLSLRLLDELIVPLQPVLVANASWPVDYLSTDDTEKSGAWVVTVSNNEGGAWTGTVLLNKDNQGARVWNACEELLTGAPVPVLGNGTSFSLTVGPFDVAAVECEVG